MASRDAAAASCTGQSPQVVIYSIQLTSEMCHYGHIIGILWINPCHIQDIFSKSRHAQQRRGIGMASRGAAAASCIGQSPQVVRYSIQLTGKVFHLGQIIGILWIIQLIVSVLSFRSVQKQTRHPTFYEVSEKIEIVARYDRGINKLILSRNLFIIIKYWCCRV